MSACVPTAITPAAGTAMLRPVRLTETAAGIGGTATVETEAAETSAQIAIAGGTAGIGENAAETAVQ